MILDTSAIVAILLKEPEERSFLDAMGRAETLRMSAGSWLELTIVITRSGDQQIADLAAELLKRFGVAIEDVTMAMAAIGAEAYRRYGKGSRHKANLNFGDCFAYALAKATDEPLLFKGNDFAETDIVPAL